MMYQHQIDECIERAKSDLKMFRKYNRQEEAEHVRRRLESLRRIREDAPRAKFGEL